MGSVSSEDLGSALIREAELFESSFESSGDDDGGVGSGGFRMYPEIQKWKAPVQKKVRPEANNGGAGKEEHDELEEDLETRKVEERRVS